MEPNLDRAASLALETLLKNDISSAPIMPLPILKKTPGVLVISFAQMSQETGIARREILDCFGENQDAATFLLQNSRVRYVVAINQSLPLVIVQRAAARELGHILLGHDGSRPESVRMAEATCFAQHFLCPRPLIASIRDSGVAITKNVLYNVTGSDDRCLACMKAAPGARVPAELNRAVRDLFAGYVENFAAYKRSVEDGSSVVDLGSFMDGYEEGNL